MKCLSIAAISLLLATCAASECTVVEVVDFRPSSQFVQITVLKDGKPQKHGRVLLSTPEGQPRMTASTDSRGKVNLSELALGNYCVAALDSSNLRDDLCLTVSKTHGRKPSLFSMNLAVKPLAPRRSLDKLEAAEKAPVNIRTQNFAGIVQDQSGAVVPGAEVAIYRRGAGDKLHPMNTKTGDRGHFSATLDPGIYTTVLGSPGFQTEVIVFEIAPDGNKEDLRVELKVGSC